MDRITGTEPGIGSFTAGITPDGEDWCIMITAHGKRTERWCSTHHGQSRNIERVYGILREHGFTMAGYQTAEVIAISNSNP